MSALKELLELFFPQYSIQNASENDLEYSIEINATSYTSPNEDALKKALNFLKQRDKLTAFISFGSAETISFKSGNTSYTDVLTELNTEYSYQTGEVVHAEIKINKTKE